MLQAAGEKVVMMLPPTTNLEPFEPYLDWNLKTEDQKSRKSRFPLHPSIDLLQKIKDAGGYYFHIKPLKNDRRGQVSYEDDTMVLRTFMCLYLR
jgi:hypothetical protein